MGYLFLEFSVISVSGIQAAHKSVGAHVSFPIAVVSLCWESWVIWFNDYLLEMFVNAHPMCLWLPFTSVTNILLFLLQARNESHKRKAIIVGDYFDI